MTVISCAKCVSKNAKPLFMWSIATHEHEVHILISVISKTTHVQEHNKAIDANVLRRHGIQVNCS